MKQEDKDLLLRDLCARLPYGGMMYNTLTKQDIPIQYFACMTDCRPYLRPMSSMTEEEKEQYLSTKVRIRSINREGNVLAVSYYDTVNTYDWLNAHHFDFRLTSEGLSMIEAGLALEASDGMYK